MVDQNYLALLKKDAQKLVEQIGHEASMYGYQAYLVGGIVRDLLLKKENLDLDIVIEGDAVVLAEHLSNMLKTELTVHPAFKTATLTNTKNECIDLASSRRELYPEPGSLPIVDNSNLEADMFRRDFTINALAIALNPDRFGELVDIYGGLKDLKKGLIRTFHENSFIDDPTRILRAARFEKRYGFEIEEDTLALLKSAIKNKCHKTVKAPRYFTEFKKILNEDNPIEALDRLQQLGALNFWDQPIKFNKRTLSAFHKRINQLKRNSVYKKYTHWWLMYLVPLIEAFSENKRKDILKKIQLKGVLVNSILACSDDKNITQQLSKKSLSKSDAYEVLKPYSVDTLLYVRLNSSKPIVNKRIDHYLSQSRKISLRIDGEDLKQLGVRNGKKIGYILQKVLYKKIDRGLKTKSQEMKAVRELLHS